MVFAATSLTDAFNQIGTQFERSQYVADLTGVNLLRGTAHGTLLELDGGGKLSCSAPANGPALAVIAPATVSVARHCPQRQEENTWPGQISAVDLMGDRVRVHVDGTPAVTAEVQPAVVDELKLDDGGEIWVSVHASDISVYPP